MTSFEIDAALARANPLPEDAAERLAVGAAEHEMLRQICAQPMGVGEMRVGWRSGSVWFRGLLVAAAAGVACVAIFAGLAARNRTPAFAAELVRFANASPLVLLDDARIVYANEDARDEGELHFASDHAQLFWRPGPLAGWVRDRAASASVRTGAPVLGTRAEVFRYRGGGHAFTALWVYDRRVLEFSATAPDLAAFEQQLSGLRRVDTTTWLRAMPSSVIRTAARATVIRRMITGIPLPAGFNPKDIRGSELVSNRYQLGAAVTGTIACEWFARWSHARNAGDHHAVARAIAALATAPRWPILRQMAKQGDYPAVLIAFAKAMPSGRWYGRPLEGDVDTGLGCTALGVNGLASPPSKHGQNPTPIQRPAPGN